MAYTQLGPWPLGEDSVHPVDDQVFQSPSKQDQPPARLKVAENVDLDDTGWPSRRAGSTSKVAGTDLLSLASAAGLLLLQDQGKIYQITPGTPYSAVQLVSGLNASLPVHFHEWEQDTVIWGNSEEGGLILSDGSTSNWGLPVPPVPTLGTTSGSIPAGDYRVVCTYEDWAGRESGAPKAADVTLAAPGGITVDLSPLSGSTAIAYINIYMAPATDQKALYWVQRVNTAALPYTITETWRSSRELTTQFLRGPIPGAGIAEYRGFLLTWRDNVIWRSHGQTIHHFQPKEFVQFEHDVRYVVGLDSGFWVATAGGLYWVAGDDPVNWAVRRMNTKAHLAGGYALQGSKLGRLQTTARVACLADTDGLVLGMPDGTLVYPTEGRMQLDATSAVQFVWRQLDATPQLMMLVL